MNRTMLICRPTGASDIGGELEALADDCIRATGPSRELDTRIAMAVFPPLQGFVLLAPGVWAHPDGSRVRALRYTGSIAAAMTLVPIGNWIEQDAGPPHSVSIHSHGSSSRPATATHVVAALAFTAAALRARAVSMP